MELNVPKNGNVYCLHFHIFKTIYTNSEENEVNANQILDEVMIDGGKEINLIKRMLEMSGNISITSIYELTTNNTSGEKTADRNQII